MSMIPLPQLPRRLAEHTGRRPGPSYASLYRAVLDGRLPAVRNSRSWEVDEADLPEVARTLGLAPAPTAGSKRAQRAAA
jgi:hypothetical protein